MTVLPVSSWLIAASLACTYFPLYSCTLFLPQLTTLHIAVITAKEVHGVHCCFFECLENFKFAVPEYTHLGITHIGKKYKAKPMWILIYSPQSSELLPWQGEANCACRTHCLSARHSYIRVIWHYYWSQTNRELYLTLHRPKGFSCFPSHYIQRLHDHKPNNFKWLIHHPTAGERGR